MNGRAGRGRSPRVRLPVWTTMDVGPHRHSCIMVLRTVLLLALGAFVAAAPVALAHDGEYEDWNGHPGPPNDCAPGVYIAPSWVYVCQDHGCEVSVEAY